MDNASMAMLGADVDEQNLDSPDVEASSLAVQSNGGRCSFKIKVAPPEGMSHARDIAEKYGVTYEMLTGSVSV